MMCVYRIYQLNVRGYIIFAFLTIQPNSATAEHNYKGKSTAIKSSGMQAFFIGGHCIVNLQTSLKP